MSPSPDPVNLVNNIEFCRECRHRLPPPPLIKVVGGRVCTAADAAANLRKRPPRPATQQFTPGPHPALCATLSQRERGEEKRERGILAGRAALGCAAGRVVHRLFWEDGSVPCKHTMRACRTVGPARGQVCQSQPMKIPRILAMGLAPTARCRAPARFAGLFLDSVQADSGLIPTLMGE